MEEEVVTLERVVEELESGYDVFPTTLGEMEIDHVHNQLRVKGRTFPLDEKTIRALCSYLKLPVTYLERCGETYGLETLSHWFDEYEESQTVVQTFHGELEKLYSQAHPPLDVLEILKTLPVPTTSIVRSYKRTPDVLEADILLDDIFDREWAPGIRVTLHPTRSSTSTTEGLFVHTDGGSFVFDRNTIPVRGSTLDDVCDVVEEYILSTRKRLEYVLERFDTLDDPVVDVETSIHELLRMTSLPKSQKKLYEDNVVAKLTEPLTYHDLVMFMVNTIPHLTRSRREVESCIGLIVLGKRPHFCPVCKQPLQP